MHDVDALLESARMIRRAGAAEIIAALTFTLSTIHDDEFYAALALRLSKSPHIDRLYIKDPSGLLTAERARALIPAIRARIGAMPLELHSHCTIGLSSQSYLVAADLGVSVLQTALGPLANGGSLPDAQRVVANLRELKHAIDVDDRLLAACTRYFAQMARAENLPFGVPQDFDAAYLRHQLAGGVLTTTRRQLAELGLEHRFGELMREVSQVRAELGYPIMVTPFPQMVCSQALFNILGAERYANVSDQIIRYALGKFGRPSAPIDSTVLGRILGRGRADEIGAEPGPPDLDQQRRQFPSGISDEEFLLRATMPAQQVDAMLAKGPACRRYNPATRPILKLLRALRDQPQVGDLVVEKPGFRLGLRRQAREDVELH
jgi:oxaloacetate decarboxylase alpha subunit